MPRKIEGSWKKIQTMRLENDTFTQTKPFFLFFLNNIEMCREGGLIIYFIMQNFINFSQAYSNIFTQIL